MRTLLLMLVLYVSASAQMVLDSFTPEVIPYPVPANQFIVLRVEFFTPTSIIFMDNAALPTAKMNWAYLDALVPNFDATHPGLYSLKVVDYLNPAATSNQWDIIVGTGARNYVCAGGILPNTATTDDVAAYKAKYFTEDCIYQAPPPGPLL